MHDQLIQEDFLYMMLYMMLYGAAAMLSLIASCYLLLRTAVTEQCQCSRRHVAGAATPVDGSLLCQHDAEPRVVFA